MQQRDTDATRCEFAASLCTFLLFGERWFVCDKTSTGTLSAGCDDVIRDRAPRRRTEVIRRRDSWRAGTRLAFAVWKAHPSRSIRSGAPTLSRGRRAGARSRCSQVPSLRAAPFSTAGRLAKPRGTGRTCAHPYPLAANFLPPRGPILPTSVHPVRGWWIFYLRVEPLGFGAFRATVWRTWGRMGCHGSGQGLDSAMTLLVRFTIPRVTGVPAKLLTGEEHDAYAEQSAVVGGAFGNRDDGRSLLVWR